MVRCPRCNAIGIIKTSWTDINPERRFYCCSKRGTNHGIIDWYDPPICERAAQIIPELLRNMNSLQASVARYQGEARRMKIMLGCTWLVLVLYFLVK
ncbi:zinc finger, GRF-type [Artemisia annua]|uniref:Zinc finger, GRF-type n=1 Tax=Artemisia annua TaxID=35608 RepID=A0A2U1L1S5_ARTAN|nr:zinc finger, GRF-type [Artemisia annua]